MKKTIIDVSNSEEFMRQWDARLTSHMRWVSTIAVAMIAIVATLVALQPSKGDIQKYAERYDPIFSNVLVDKAYALLSDVHLTEIQHKPDLARNIAGVRRSLEEMGELDHRNAGLGQVLSLVGHLAQGGNKAAEEAFLKIDAQRDSSLDMTPQERGFFFTFQGLLYLRKLRQTDDPQIKKRFLTLGYDRLMQAKQLNPAISNMWNGLGIILLEQAHDEGKLELIDQARGCFRISFDLFRSPINYAAEINNLTYANMIVAYYSFFKTVDISEGPPRLTLQDKKKIEDAILYLEEQYKEIEKALLYDPQAVSILLSKAESLCLLALCKRALEISRGSPKEFSGADSDLERAMDIIRDAKVRGFRDWSYLFSREWISETVLRVPKYREELLKYPEP